MAGFSLLNVRGGVFTPLLPIRRSSGCRPCSTIRPLSRAGCCLSGSVSVPPSRWMLRPRGLLQAWPAWLLKRCQLVRPIAVAAKTGIRSLTDSSTPTSRQNRSMRCSCQADDGLQSVGAPERLAMEQSSRGGMPSPAMCRIFRHSWRQRPHLPRCIRHPGSPARCRRAAHPPGCCGR